MYKLSLKTFKNLKKQFKANNLNLNNTRFVLTKNNDWVYLVNKSDGGNEKYSIDICNYNCQCFNQRWFYKL